MAEAALVERERELGVLTAALDAARSDGRGAVVYLTGEAGIGKSTLLDVAAAAAAEAGMDVMRARGHELETEYPFGIAVQLLSARVARAPADERAALLEGTAANAEPILTGRGSAAGADPFPLVHALTWVVSNAGELRPVALFVDDAHLADGPSLRFLNYLAQRTGDLPVVLVVAARPPVLGPATELLPRLRAGADVATLDLSPLSRGGVGWLMAGLGFAGADPAFVAACADASGGNPFLLRELLFVLAEESVEATAESSARVEEIGPRAVAEATYLALTRVGADGTALARSVAVLGDGVPMAMAARLAHLDDDAAVVAARRLADAGVFATSGALDFAHPILRAAVYQDLRDFERAYAHARAAVLHHEAGAAPELVAAQLTDSEPVGEPWAIEALRTTGQRALGGGEAGSAVRFFERALAEPGAADDPELLVQAAMAQNAAGSEEAPDTVRRALELVEDPLRRAEMLLLLGRAYLTRGRYAEAVEAFQSGVEACPGGQPGLAADLRTGWASAAMWDPERGAAVLAEVAAEVMAIAEPETAGERTALANVAGATLIDGRDAKSAGELARRAWGDGALLRMAGPEDPSIYSVTATFLCIDQFDLAMEVWNALLDAARARGLLLVAATAAYGRGNSHYMYGRLDDALADTELALEAEREGGCMYASAAYWTLARVLIERGDLERAEQGLQIPAEREEELSTGVDYGVLLFARGELAYAQGRYAEALEHFDAGRQRFVVMGWEVNVFSWRHTAARVELALGKPDEARATAQDAVDLARVWGVPSYTGIALRTAAAVSARDDEALELLRESVELLDGSPARLEAAYARVDLGRALLSGGDPDGGRESLRLGLEMAEGCGATVLAEKARAALVETGARPRRARSTGRDSLTPAELRVAHMAAAGQTNREIAEGLFVTLKAVKWHLGNIYRKLGITSRDELSDRLAE